jgi:hypothetical protein
VDRHAPLAEFERIAGEYPVFRVDPVTASGSSVITLAAQAGATPTGRVGERSHDAGLSEADDDTLTMYAHEHRAVLVTHDDEFSRRRRRNRGRLVETWAGPSGLPSPRSIVMSRDWQAGGEDGNNAARGPWLGKVRSAEASEKRNAPCRSS